MPPLHSKSFLQYALQYSTGLVFLHSPSTIHIQYPSKCICKLSLLCVYNIGIITTVEVHMCNMHMYIRTYIYMYVHSILLYVLRCV